MAALNLVRRERMEGFTSRNLGAELGTSTRPVFTAFKNMDELQNEALKAAKAVYDSYERILTAIQDNHGLSEDESVRMFQTMWLFTHGIACLHVTGMILFTDDEVMERITEVFSGTVEDLALLAITLTPPADTSGLLFDKRETFDMMFTPSTLNPSVLSGTHHGLLRYDGVPLTIGHWGNNSAGGSANFVIAPSENFGVATLSNVGKVNDFITDRVIDLLFGNTIDMETPIIGNLPNASEVAGNYVPTSRFDGSLFEFVAYSGAPSLRQAAYSFSL